MLCHRPVLSFQAYNYSRKSNHAIVDCPLSFSRSCLGGYSAHILDISYLLFYLLFSPLRYVVVDDIWLKIAPFFKRPGPAPECPDSELLAMALIGECRGWDLETEMLSHWQAHRDLFPVIPTQSRFNRRRRSLMHAFNLIRRVILQCLDVAQDQQCVVDSLPLPLVQFRLVPFAATRFLPCGSWCLKQVSQATLLVLVDGGVQGALRQGRGRSLYR